MTIDEILSDRRFIISTGVSYLTFNDNICCCIEQINSANYMVTCSDINAAWVCSEDGVYEFVDNHHGISIKESVCNVIDLIDSGALCEF